MITKEFNRFFKKQSLASTYKPMFLKCLLDLGDYNADEGGKWVKRNSDSLMVDLNFIAARFIRFYIPLYFKFKLKQFPHPDKTLDIYEILENFRGKINTKGIPSKKTVSGKKFEGIRKKVIQSDGFKREVLPRLLNDCNIYKINSGKKSITIKKETIEFMKNNKNLLESGLNNMIAVYLEGINSSPNISTKIREKIPRKTLKKPVIDKIKKIQHGKCFFCNCKLGKYAQEHFLPWNFISRTENFNITAACINCNSSKNDKLPTRKYLKKIIYRNKKLTNLPIGYSDTFFEKLYETCKIDYHGNLKKNTWTPKTQC